MDCLVINKKLATIAYLISNTQSDRQLLAIALCIS